MTLREHIQKAVEICGSQAALARAAGISAPAISYMLNEPDRGISAETAIRIERATAGAVNRHHLRPDFFGPAPVAG